ncbi:hypothetical protein M1D80_09500 [Phyllobacteriaceae bacterium JZ32]
MNTTNAKVEAARIRKELAASIKFTAAIYRREILASQASKSFRSGL